MRVRLLCLIALLLSCVALSAAPMQIHYRNASGKWLPLPCRVDAGRGVISFTLDPKTIGSGTTTVILGDTKGIALDDTVAPVVTGLKLDGRSVRVSPVTDLDWLAETPQAITIGLGDKANALDLSTLKVQLNGKVLGPNEYQRVCAAGGKSVTLGLPMAKLLAGDSRFQNTIDVRVSDVAPAQNSSAFRLTYRHLGAVTEDTIIPESSYVGYEDLKVLTDGKIMKPGETTYGSTWAAEEVPGDHWLVFAWPQEKTVSGVEIFWATYGGTYHAPLKLLVQTWDGKQWVTQQTLTNLKAERSTSIELAPVATSRLRLLQPDGQGNPVRPNIMWITEISVKAQ